MVKGQCPVTGATNNILEFLRQENQHGAAAFWSQLSNDHQS
jgi:hypothetical protein